MRPPFAIKPNRGTGGPAAVGLWTDSASERLGPMTPGSAPVTGASVQGASGEHCDDTVARPASSEANARGVVDVTCRNAAEKAAVVA